MPATAAAVLRVPKRLGTAQNVRIYRGRRAGENVYGVAFGGLRPEPAPEALAVAERMGTVEVGRGGTGGTTPAAGPYIERALARTKTAATA